MGFALFTSSGTFNPSTYGLSPGDLIHIKCVGGGGGGGNDNIAGTAGGASSFGSILSAAGGLGASKGAGVQPTIVANSDPGGSGVVDDFVSFTYGVGNTPKTLCIRGCGVGGSGWHPQLGFVGGPKCAAEFCKMFSPMGIYAQTNGALMYGGASPAVSIAQRIYLEAGRQISSTSSGIISSASTMPYGYAGGGNYSANSNTYFLCLSAGGVGYGAGGGGGCYATSTVASGNGAGGNGGVIEDMDYVLTSSGSVAITVGDGGTGATRSGSNYPAGGGARGCVAIWW